jgi:hypothetical protein
MKFTNTLLTLAPFMALVSADGIFSITGTGSTSSTGSTVTLQVLNGLVGDAPTCSGTSSASALPASGSIPCKDGYALTYTWSSLTQGIAATYTNPSVTFTYNVPNNGCADQTCQFGFTNLFPGKKEKRFSA